jgi:hypothetical protein
MNVRAYLRKEDQARGQGDLKHAYDGVQQWAVEVVLMRMGVPEEVGCANEDICDHPIWGYRDVQESVRAATGWHS